MLVQQQQEDVGINDKIEVQRDKTKKVEVSSLRGLKFQRKAPRKKELKVFCKCYYINRRKNEKKHRLKSQEPIVLLPIL